MFIKKLIQVGLNKRGQMNLKKDSMDEETEEFDDEEELEDEEESPIN